MFRVVQKFKRQDSTNALCSLLDSPPTAKTQGGGRRQQRSPLPKVEFLTHSNRTLSTPPKLIQRFFDSDESEFPTAAKTWMQPQMAHKKKLNTMNAVVISLVGLFALSNISGAEQAKEAPAQKSIVETAVAAGSFKTLVAALKAADLVDALSGKGDLTVFAPTDEAFAKLPKGTLENLLKKENKALLTEILTYHVVKGAVPAKVAVTLDSATALNKKKITLKTKGKNLHLHLNGNAKVTKADIQCSNGIIHVIDEVILPPTKKS